jgi:hypothetical protein
VHFDRRAYDFVCEPVEVITRLPPLLSVLCVLAVDHAS